jgi:hypothetical protein
MHPWLNILILFFSGFTEFTIWPCGDERLGYQQLLVEDAGDGSVYLRRPLQQPPL